MKFARIFKLLRLFPVFLMVFLFSMPSQAQKKIKYPTNIILFIGDGMGVTQLYSGLTLNHGQLNLAKFTSIGFSKTYSASDYVTDSGAGGTAISTGKKTYNGAIGVGIDSSISKTILEYAEDKGLSTGIVATSSLTDATPASFIAHENTRYLMENIAASYLKTDIDVFIGGGLKYFTMRKDNRNLLNELRNKGYQVFLSMDSIKDVHQGKLAGFTANDNNLTIKEGRDKLLPSATQTAIGILSNNKKGFFLMVEGSLIDKVAHVGKGEDVAQEVIDFDQAIGNALDYAAKDGNTLIIVTADHETGGMSLLNGNFENGTIDAKFTTPGHSGVMVPVFAWGPGADLFQGIQENTDLFQKMMNLLKLAPEKEKNE
jgi:alkaline phosphatase